LVVQPGERAPRLALVLILPLATTGDLTGHGETGREAQDYGGGGERKRESPECSCHRHMPSSGRGRSRHWLSARVGRPVTRNAVPWSSPGGSCHPVGSSTSWRTHAQVNNRSA